MLNPSASGAVRIDPEGNLIIVVAGVEIRIDLTVNELRHLAVALAVAADRREGLEPPAAALAILEHIRGTA
mgnify:CR=1 FL=1